MNLSELINTFYENNREIVSLIDNNDLKKTKKQLKKFNLEYDIHIEDEITKNLIYITNIFNAERIVVACLNRTNEVFFEYSSNEVLINEETFILNKTMPYTGIYCDGWNLKFEFTGDNEAMELKHTNVYIHAWDSNTTIAEMIYAQKMFDLLCAQIEQYDIKILKLLTGDTHYLESIDFNMIFLENDNNILKEFCQNKFIFNSLNINKYIIEKKEYNIVERIKLYKSKFVNRKKVFYSQVKKYHK